MNFLKRLLGIGTSVDAILGDFSKVTKKLYAHIEAKNVEIDAHEAVIFKAQELRATAMSEMARAGLVARNISTLLGAVPVQKAA